MTGINLFYILWEHSRVREINYSGEVRRNLDEIWDYIASEIQNRPAAERTVSRIMDAVEQIEQFAEIGLRYHLLPISRAITTYL